MTELVGLIGRNSAGSSIELPAVSRLAERLWVEVKARLCNFREKPLNWVCWLQTLKLVLNLSIFDFTIRIIGGCRNSINSILEPELENSVWSRFCSQSNPLLLPEKCWANFVYLFFKSNTNHPELLFKLISEHCRAYRKLCRIAESRTGLAAEPQPLSICHFEFQSLKCEKQSSNV